MKPINMKEAEEQFDLNAYEEKQRLDNFNPGNVNAQIRAINQIISERLPEIKNGKIMIDDYASIAKWGAEWDAVEDAFKSTEFYLTYYPPHRWLFIGLRSHANKQKKEAEQKRVPENNSGCMVTIIVGIASLLYILLQ